MIEKLIPNKHKTEETLARSVVKTVSYRVVILVCDFALIFLYTHQVKVAVGFMVVSNSYSTIGYFFHERIWGKIKWGKLINKKADG